MPLTPGTRLGPFELVSILGFGGMGEVYRATDTKLKRQVAIKVLPPSLATDRDRLARFQREAEVLASLNHPNIAAIYGLEESEGVTALVMELVEGDDLSQRLAKGAIPVDEALPIAKQIAEALEAAHEQGIIHRDLKPANIKVRRDGTVKVLDFGLAKALAPAGSQDPAYEDLTQSPTLTTPAMTQAGMILGTAAYMSPEQARGTGVDKRADLWAFGVVLFEMLTAKRVFGGATISDTIASVLKTEPAWQALPSATPTAIRRLLRRCLEKDRKRRLDSAADARLELDEAIVDPATGPPALDGAVVVARWRRLVTPLTAALAAAVVAGTGVWVARRPVSLEPLHLSRLLLDSSGAARATLAPNNRDLAITPDGSRVVYVGNRGTQLLVRALDTLAPVAVFTGAPLDPFVSPDGQWIGFVDGTNTLKKVSVTGGPPVTLATMDGYPRGAAWGLDDAIIFTTTNGTTGLQRVGAAGGPIAVLTRPERAKGETDHLWPEVLPGGGAVLFTIMPVTGGLDAAQVAVLDVKTGTSTILVRGGSHAHYVPSERGSPQGSGREDGYLVYATAGVLRAVAFDRSRLETRGASVPVVPDVLTKTSGAVDAVMAGDGTLAYVSGKSAGEALRTMVWVDRQGLETPIAIPPRAYLYPRLSPDGSRIAVYLQDQERDLWLVTLGRAVLTRLTFDPALDPYGVWTPDGRRMIFGSDRAGGRNLFWQAADGTGGLERLTESPNEQNPVSVTPDGRRVIFTEVTLTNGDDVMQLELEGSHRVTPLLQSAASERNAVVSPDGRWLVYEANDSGRFEIYVRPYPEVNTGRWQVSADGGARPLWARNGRELFYLSPKGAVMRVDVDRGPSWSMTTPTTAVKEGYYTVPGGNSGRTYDVSLDGRRFLMIKEGDGSGQTIAPPDIVVVQHWTEELRRLVTAK